MRKIFSIVIVIVAVAFFSTMLLAQNEPAKPAKEGSSMSKSGTMKSDSGKDTGSADKMKSREQWAAEHKKMQEEMKAMDQRLEEKVAAMNAATGDRKIGAMSDVINELVAQRKQMREKFKASHGKMGGTMMHGKCDMHGEMHGEGGMHHGGMHGMHGGGGPMMGGQDTMKGSAPAAPDKGGAKL